MANYTRVKDIATDIMELAIGTGYDYDYLCLLTESLVQKYGHSYDEAVGFVSRFACSGAARKEQSL